MAVARLLYIAHTGERIREQALYAALSALAWRGDDEVVLHLYTDAPDAFARVAAHADIRLLTPELLKAWRGPSGYVHRTKPVALRELRARYPGERIALVDADTFFTAPVGRLFDGLDAPAIAMWEREYSVLRRESMMMLRFRRHMRGCTFRGAPVDLDVDMWNSGVVAIGPGLDGIVDDWIAFLDEVFPRSRRWVLEQFALAWLAQRRGIPLLERNDVLFHYHAQKTAYEAEVRAFLARTAALPLDETLAALRASRIRVAPPPPAPPRRPNVFQRLFGW